MTRFQDMLDILRSGDVIAIPTDTVYGLACDMRSESAVQKIYNLKGRPAHKALPIFIGGIDDLTRTAKGLSDDAWQLAKKYWPGPLTLVVKKLEDVPDFVTTGVATVAIRIPNHPEILTLLKKYGAPLAVTSANRSGDKELMTADAVKTVFKDQVTILEGVCGGNGVSTIVDTTVQPMRIIRQGILNLPELAV